MVHLKAPIKGKFQVLSQTPQTITRAVFWNIPHNSGREDIRLKLGRYQWVGDPPLDEELESKTPKSEVTLSHDELLALIELLRNDYAPFKEGVRAYIPLNKPFSMDNANQIKALFELPEKAKLAQFILSNEIIPSELAVALRQAHRIRALNKFEAMLNGNLVEGEWQRWFQSNSWVLGSQFVQVLEERQIDTQHISDFLMQAYDGFLDIVEIKRPDGGLQFWATMLDHGNYVPSSDLTKAIAQASRYIYEVEREANNVKFLDRVNGIRTVKPRCVLVFGRSNDWNAKQAEAYRIFNSAFHNLTLLTYDHVLARARRICGIDAENQGG